MVKYKGILARKVEIPPLGSKKSPESEGYERFAEEREAALFAHYGIPRGEDWSWLALALSLAEENVPAYTRAQGRPPLNSAEDVRLYDYFIAIKQRDKCSDIGAHQKIAERDDVFIDAVAVKERLKQFRRKYPEVCREREDTMLELLGGPVPEATIPQMLRDPEPTQYSVDEITRYQQEFTRYPYGPIPLEYSLLSGERE